MLQDEWRPLDGFAGLAGALVLDPAGDRIGTVEEIFYDARSRPEWLVVGTDAVERRRVLVPTVGLAIAAGAVVVPYRRTIVDDAPGIDGDPGDDMERSLYAYYGLPGSDRGPSR